MAGQPSWKNHSTPPDRFHICSLNWFCLLISTHPYSFRTVIAERYLLFTSGSPLLLLLNPLLSFIAIDLNPGPAPLKRVPLSYTLFTSWAFAWTTDFLSNGFRKNVFTMPFTQPFAKQPSLCRPTWIPSTPSKHEYGAFWTFDRNPSWRRLRFILTSNRQKTGPSLSSQPRMENKSAKLLEAEFPRDAHYTHRGSTWPGWNQPISTQDT